MAKSGRWKEEELILALDLYLKLGPKIITSLNKLKHKNNRIENLSKILNDNSPLNLKKRGKSYRDYDEVCGKLFNYHCLNTDEDLGGGGNYTKNIENIWKRYKDNANRKEQVEKAAIEIQKSWIMVKQKDKDDVFDESQSFPEGKHKWVLHLLRERNREIVNRKKRSVGATKLICEACKFNFYTKYGEEGRNFIECHHKKPVSEMEYGDETTLKDLVLLCSNCHRMAHHGELKTSEDIKKLIRKAKMTRRKSF